MSDAETSKSRRGPGRPSNEERRSTLAQEIESTLTGLAELLEPPADADMDSLAGIIKRDAPAIAKYLAGLADRSGAAEKAIRRVLSAFGAVRAFGPLVGALAGRVLSRGELEPEPEQQPGGALA